jgi:hypothetical protein
VQDDPMTKRDVLEQAIAHAIGRDRAVISALIDRKM